MDRFAIKTNLTKHHGPPIMLIILLFSFCMGNLVPLPFGYLASIKGLETVGIDLETENLFENTESDEEYISRIDAAASGDLFSSELRSTHLNSQNFLLAPVSPPPIPA